MYKIKTLNKISPVGMAGLDGAKYTVSDQEAAPDAILVRSAAMHEYSFNPELRCIARAGAGTNNIPLDRCAEKGIVVFNTPGANSQAVKELVICAMLLTGRDVIGGIEWVKSIADKGDEISKMVEKGKSAFAGPELMGKTLGVVGLGAIGAKIANTAISLGMKVYGYDPFLSVQNAWMLSSNVKHAENLDTIYKNCDFISLHLPANADTKGMINSESLDTMKDGVRIINMARGELVNDDDIIAAIDIGKVMCYVTDFPNAKTANAKNVIAIPHLGASTPESEDNCAVMAVEQTADYLENGNIVNSVNMPAASMPRSGASRLCVIHKNIPDTISSILSCFQGSGINIENMINKSRGGYAYTMIDVNSPITDEVRQKVEALDWAILVRVL